MRSRWNFPIILYAVIILLPLLLPLRETGTLHEFDMILHLERMVAFFRSLKEHYIPPSWSTYLAYGFGSPVLIYNWSFPYYLASIPLWAGATLVTSYKYITAVTYIGSFTSMLAFLSLVTSPLSSLVGAAWYVWAPYRFNINQLRGAIGEQSAMMFWPAVFWATLLIFRRRYWLGFLTGALLWTGLILSHQPLFGMIMPLWFLFTSIELVLTKNTRSLLLAVGALLFGMGLTAYSWFPIVFERGYLGYGLHEMIFPDNYVEWRQLLSQPKLMEFQQQFGRLFYAIGWPVIGIALVSLIIMVGNLRHIFRTRLLMYLVVFLLMGILAIALMRPISAYLWQHLPLLAPTVVYPQRFLALVAFCGSVLAGLVAHLVSKGRHRWMIPVAFIAGIILFNYPYITLNQVRETDLARLNSPILTTTDVWGEFSPKGIPDDFRQNGPRYAKQPLVTVTPETDTTPPCVQTSVSVTCTVDTSAPSSVRFRQFYFPGWHASADRVAVPITQRDDGTMVLQLPKPTRTVAIHYKGTLLQVVGKILTLLSIMLYIFLIGKRLYIPLLLRFESV